MIAGGGLGGLTAAVALHRRGWEVGVVERAAALEPVGAGISLWPNALRALDSIGIDARDHATLTGPSGVRRPDGTWLARSDIGAAIRQRFGDPLVLLHRAELIDLLVRQLPDGSVQAGTTVLGVHPGAESAPATLFTEFGESEAELVVAADGIRSTLRGFLFPRHPGPRYAGYTAWRAVVPNPGRIGTGFETWGTNGRRFAVLPLGADRLYCYATVTAEAGARARDEVGRLRELFGDWHEPIPDLLAHLTPENLLHDDVEELPEPLPALHRGRVALLGDAAHAMTPDLGQGGGMAIEDAVELAHALGDDGRHVLPALEDYTRRRLTRTTAVARKSRRAGRLYSAPYPVQVLAARLMGALPGATVSRGLAPVVDWRPPGDELPG